MPIDQHEFKAMKDNPNCIVCLMPANNAIHQHADQALTKENLEVIQALRLEAHEAKDTDLVELCAIALWGGRPKTEAHESIMVAEAVQNCVAIAKNRWDMKETLRKAKFITSQIKKK